MRRISSKSSLSLLKARFFNTFSSPPLLSHGIHVLYCPDSVGIVAKISECIASRGGNILEADVFVPQNKNVFYSRSEFVFDPIKWPRAQMDEDILNLSKMFNARKSAVRVPFIDPKYKIAVLVSKQDHCLVDLLLAWQDGKLPIDISAIISNHDRLPNSHVARFLERHKIPYHYLSTTKENKREEEILHLVQDTDFLVLARYMQAFNAGVKLIGATSHFVTEELDDGPIIEQMVFTLALSVLFYGVPLILVERVSHKDNLLSFVQKSENLEKQCLLKAIKSYCDLRVLPYEDNRTVLPHTSIHRWCCLGASDDVGDLSFKFGTSLGFDDPLTDPASWRAYLDVVVPQARRSVLETRDFVASCDCEAMDSSLTILVCDYYLLLSITKAPTSHAHVLQDKFNALEKSSQEMRQRFDVKRGTWSREMRSLLSISNLNVSQVQ
ncbi:formyltetrahydrofolate deformylase 1, mitochondrial isoform X1 [Tanacetum coccineum]